MRAILFRLVIFWCMGAASAFAQSIPGANPVMTVITDEGEQEETSYEGSAPVEIRFEARPENLGSYTAYYEWRFYTQGNELSPYIIRYDENTAYTFMTSGQTFIDLLITFVDGKDTINYEMDEPFVVSVSESKLEMPNAFLPMAMASMMCIRQKTDGRALYRLRLQFLPVGGKNCMNGMILTGDGMAR